jgi:hypothetical protein
MVGFTTASTLTFADPDHDKELAGTFTDAPFGFSIVTVAKR